jgi:tetratricopeptide (TPR) repeat protein
LLRIREAEKKNDLNLAHARHEVADLYYFQGRYEEAEPLYQRCLSILKTTFLNGHPNIDTCQKNYDDLKRKMSEQ